MIRGLSLTVYHRRQEYIVREIFGWWHDEIHIAVPVDLPIIRSSALLTICMIKPNVDVVHRVDMVCAAKWGSAEQ
jgi:hypothetical protein